MRTERIWEKPGRGWHGRWIWLVSRQHILDGHAWTICGYGETPAEARADLLCQVMRCSPTHAKPHQPVTA